MTVRNDLRVRKDQILILFFGRLDPVYKADLTPLLIALSSLSQRSAPVILAIAGSDDRGYGSQLQSLAQSLGIAEIVRIVPSPDEEMKAALLAECDVFVSPSDNIQESFGLSVLEAMANAKPVVASDWNGYRDLVVHGETGFLVRTSVYRPCLDAAELLLPFDPSTQSTTGLLASQTVVDVNDLTDSLAALAHSRELRLNMGAAGRRRVKAEFCWPLIVRQYREVFDEQLRIKRRNRKKHLSQCAARTFGHYSTEMFDASTKVQASEAVRHSEAIAAGLVGSVDVATTLLRLARQPTSIETLGHDVTSRSTVMRMLKLGLLRVVKAQRSAVRRSAGTSPRQLS